MKLVQIVPKSGANLGSAIKNKELELRGKGTTFFKEGKTKWKHVRFPGWINISRAKGGILIAEIQTKKEGTEWQLFSAFIGYLDRHFGDLIDTISVHYR